MPLIRLLRIVISCWEFDISRTIARSALIDTAMIFTGIACNNYPTHNAYAHCIHTGDMRPRTRQVVRGRLRDRCSVCASVSAARVSHGSVAAEFPARRPGSPGGRRGSVDLRTRRAAAVALSLGARAGPVILRPRPGSPRRADVGANQQLHVAWAVRCAGWPRRASSRRRRAQTNIASERASEHGRY